MNKINILALVIIICCINISFAQVHTSTVLKTDNSNIQELMKINYFTLKYRFLDKNFKVKMSSTDFQFVKKKYGFSNAQTAKDSLGIALMGEFNDWDKARIAELRLTYTWLRLSYHLLLTDYQTKELAKEFKIKYPWLLKQTIADNSTSKAKKVIIELKKRIQKIEPDLDLSLMSADDLMRKALDINPARKQKYAQESRHKH